jgi:opacity protein-like surface antigen
MMLRASLRPVLAVFLLLATSAATPTPARADGWEAFPEDHLYRPYMADPGEPRFGLGYVHVSDPAIVDSGETRVHLQLGGTFGLFRKTSAAGDAPDTGRFAGPRGWQLDFQAGFNGQFDSTQSLDNIGWDGVYALFLSRSLGSRAVARMGVHHTSSHVGDEFLERTGRGRIDYTREEVVASLSGRLSPSLRVYGEIGSGFGDVEDFQRSGRFQAGFELDRPGTLRGTLGWFLATDLNTYEERDWSVDASIMAGLTWGRERRWRAGLQYYDGRVPIGEFFQDDESWLALGAWLDL